MKNQNKDTAVIQTNGRVLSHVMLQLTSLSCPRKMLVSLHLEPIRLNRQIKKKIPPTPKSKMVPRIKENITRSSETSFLNSTLDC